MRSAAIRLSLGLGLLLLASAGSEARAEGMQRLQQEFQQAIEVATRAAVVCRPWGVAPERAGFSSGVVIHERGLILSDGDAGLVWEGDGDQPVRSWRSRVEVRMSREGEDAPRVYEARVLFRNRDLDASLLEVLAPPKESLPFVRLGVSDSVRVGDFALALGTAFEEHGCAPTTVTAGLISSLDIRPEADSKHHVIYTSAAINQGVNGGPVVGLDGRLLGIVSTYLDPEPDERHPFLGRVVPIDRIMRAVVNVSASAELPDATALPRAASAGRALEDTFLAAARQTWPSVVSIKVHRRAPLRRETLLEERQVLVPRYEGPVTGFFVDEAGTVLTSLYNLSNLAERVRPLWTPPPGATVAEGLADIEGATVHAPDGKQYTATYLGHDLRLGVAAFRIRPTREDAALPVRLLAPAKTADLRAGRFVLALGNPYAHERPEDPLLTMGVLSKHHPKSTPAPWRGQWQTDAPGIDTNVGGPVVDLDGQLLGMLTVWHPARHGRGSGVAFVVPWHEIEQALPALLRDEGPKPGLLGVTFERRQAAVIASVNQPSAAATAGVRPGDRLVEIDGVPVPTIVEARRLLASRFAGERCVLIVRRGGSRITLESVLGAK